MLFGIALYLFVRTEGNCKIVTDLKTIYIFKNRDCVGMIILEQNCVFCQVEADGIYIML